MDFRDHFFRDIRDQLVSPVIKKINMTSSVNWRLWGVVVHAVRIRLPTSTKLRVSHSAEKINHRLAVHNAKLHDGLAKFGISLSSVNTVIKN